MAATGLDVFDKTLQTTNIWLNEIMGELGPDRQVAYRALAAVLHTLRDRLTNEEAAHLGAQLPILIRGIYYDGWRPAAQPQVLRSREAFLEAIAERLSNIRPVNPETAARAVFATLRRHVTEGEIEEVMAMLPEPIRALWPDVEPPPRVGAKREERSER